MSILKVKIAGYVYELDVDKNYLQKMYGTFKNEHTPFKMERFNWDNSEFFDYQSKTCFPVLVNAKTKTIQMKRNVSAADKNELWNAIYKDNPMKSSNEIDGLVKQALQERETETDEKQEKRFKMKYYCDITCYFLNGEWNFKTEYSESDIRKTYKTENSKDVLTSYEYTGDELGLFDCPNEDIFASLF